MSAVITSAVEQSLPVFAELLHDSEDKVRVEAPETFRVMGKRHPERVRPYLEILKSLAENDPNPVVRIHSVGAIQRERFIQSDQDK